MRLVYTHPHRQATRLFLKVEVMRRGDSHCIGSHLEDIRQDVLRPSHSPRTVRCEVKNFHKQRIGTATLTVSVKPGVHGSDTSRDRDRDRSRSRSRSRGRGDSYDDGASYGRGGDTGVDVMLDKAAMSFLGKVVSRIERRHPEATAVKYLRSRFRAVAASSSSHGNPYGRKSSSATQQAGRVSLAQFWLLLEKNAGGKPQVRRRHR